MSTPTSASPHIRLGPWVNWEQGAIRGSQVTLSPRNAQILSSFLGIFITVVGVQLWQIVSYMIHQLRSTEGHSDGLHQQLQVVLRNTSSPWSAVKAFVEQLWAWRKNAARSFLRTIPWAVLALIYAIAFAVLSIFASSEIVKAPGSARLLQSQNCGLDALEEVVEIQSIQGLEAGWTKDAKTAAQYAKSCYPGNSTASTVTCDAYAVPYIPFESTHTSCPVSEEMCVKGNSTPIMMDTGLLDSRTHFGVNAPSFERLQWRKVTTCSPIHLGNYTQFVEVTAENNSTYPGKVGDLIAVVNAGPLYDSSNYTFQYNTHANIDNIGYGIQAYQAMAQRADSTWDPIPALNRTNADVEFIALMANAIEFLTPVNDPMFSAHRYLPVPLNGPNAGVWLSDYDISGMACAEQYQWCNPNNRQCTDLTSLSASGMQLYSLGVNKAQSLTALRLDKGALLATVYQTISGRGASALLAQDGVYLLQQNQIPDNQWELEVAGWFESSLARVQDQMQRYASRASMQNVTAPAANDSLGQSQCRNQITMNTQGTVSFSLLGLGFVLCFGAVIIVVGFAVEPVVSFIQRKSGRGLQGYRDWKLNDKLQLHRMALESRGAGPWAKPADAIPVAEKGVFFEGWQESDLEDGTRRWEEAHRQDYEGAGEGKPFMTGEQDTGYHGGPTLHVDEYDERRSS